MAPAVFEAVPEIRQYDHKPVITKKRKKLQCILETAALMFISRNQWGWKRVGEYEVIKELKLCWFGCLFIDQNKPFSSFNVLNMSLSFSTFRWSDISPVSLNVGVWTSVSQQYPFLCNIRQWEMYNMLKLNILTLSCCVRPGNSSTAGGRSEDGEGASRRGESAVVEMTWNEQSAVKTLSSASVFACKRGCFIFVQKHILSHSDASAGSLDWRCLRAPPLSHRASL